MKRARVRATSIRAFEPPPFWALPNSSRASQRRRGMRPSTTSACSIEVIGLLMPQAAALT